MFAIASFEHVPNALHFYVDVLNDIKLLWEDAHLPVIVHAMSKDGEIAVMGIGDIAPDTRYVFWDSMRRVVQSEIARIVV